MIKWRISWFWRHFRTPNDPSGTHERALTRNGFYIWLEEFREQHHTGTRNHYCARKIWASNLVKLCVNLGRFFIDNFGLVNSFWLALFMAQDMVRLHVWEWVRSPGKSICKRLSGDKVILHVIKWRISRFGDVSGTPKTSPGPKIARWRAMDSTHGSKN